eukprot:210415-Pleurochrysis_carterae.AAC.1
MQLRADASSLAAAVVDEIGARMRERAHRAAQRQRHAPANAAAASHSTTSNKRRHNHDDGRQEDQSRSSGHDFNSDSSSMNSHPQTGNRAAAHTSSTAFATVAAAPTATTATTAANSTSASAAATRSKRSRHAAARMMREDRSGSDDASAHRPAAPDGSPTRAHARNTNARAAGEGSFGEDNGTDTLCDTATHGHCASDLYDKVAWSMSAELVDMLSAETE